MKYRLYRSLTAALLAVALLLCAACGAEEPAAPENPQPPAAEQTQPEQETLPTPEQTAPEETPPTDTFSFADVADLEFYFSSGAGAWRTVLYIHADGTFDGLYTDSDMGDLDPEAYPNGTRYICEFSGRFAAPVQEDDYTWMLEVEELTYARPFGEEELADGFRYVYSKAYGIAGVEGLFLFAPGTPLAELPEAYLRWVGYYDLTQTEETELPFYGLYDSVGENGFSSYPLPDPAELLQAELTATEQLAAEAEQTLQAALTQTDMNVAAAELYRIWDDMLNIAWMYLKEELDQETMQQLTTEQLTWIQEKEAAAAAAGAAYEGGSIQGMAVSLEAAELTKQRVYVLAKYLQ